MLCLFFVAVLFGFGSSDNVFLDNPLALLNVLFNLLTKLAK